MAGFQSSTNELLRSGSSFFKSIVNYKNRAAKALARENAKKQRQQATSKVSIKKEVEQPINRPKPDFAKIKAQWDEVISENQKEITEHPESVYNPVESTASVSGESSKRKVYDYSKRQRIDNLKRQMTTHLDKTNRLTNENVWEEYADVKEALDSDKRLSKLSTEDKLEFALLKKDNFEKLTEATGRNYTEDDIDSIKALAYHHFNLGNYDEIKADELIQAQYQQDTQEYKEDWIPNIDVGEDVFGSYEPEAQEAKEVLEASISTKQTQKDIINNIDDITSKFRFS